MTCEYKQQLPPVSGQSSVDCSLQLNSGILEGNLMELFFFLFFSSYRTKWKRQTAVGLELLAEAGNYASLQRMYAGAGGNGYAGWPYGPGAVGGPQGPAAAAAAAASMDLYYRQAAAAAALQKPLPYRLYPPGQGQPGQPGSSSSPISTSSPLPQQPQPTYPAGLSPLLSAASASAGLSSLAAASSAAAAAAAASYPRADSS